MRSAPEADRGAVTAETAVALPGLVLILATALAAIGAAGAQLACADAARIGARALARGDDLPAVHALAADAAPAGARIELSEEAGLARVTVRAALGLGPHIDTPIEVSGSAAVPLEPGSRP